MTKLYEIIRKDDCIHIKGDREVQLEWIKALVKVFDPHGSLGQNLKELAFSNPINVTPYLRIYRNPGELLYKPNVSVEERPNYLNFLEVYFQKAKKIVDETYSHNEKGSNKR